MKRLLLAGGGQAHVFVLRALERRRPADVEVTLVTPSDRLIYTGMLPGWIAGHYQLNDLTIALAPLVRTAGVRTVQGQVDSLDLGSRSAHTDRGDAIYFDLISIATGPSPNFDAIVGARDHTLPLRPLDRFVTEWQRIARQAQTARAPFCVTIIGAGAGGIEIALAVRHRLSGVQVQLITGATALLPAHNAGARALAQRALIRAGVQMIEATAERVERNTVVLSTGRTLATDATLLMTGAAAPSWLRRSELATDQDGFVATNEYLQSTSHDFVFAAGDCATMMHARRPKSGVYAVRGGPHLAGNLLAALSARPLERWRPQRRALYLLATGAKHAIASWGRIAFSGRWVWRWKNRIDCRYIAKFRAVD